MGMQRPGLGQPPMLLPPQHPGSGPAWQHPQGGMGAMGMGMPGMLQASAGASWVGAACFLRQQGAPLRTAAGLAGPLMADPPPHPTPTPAEQPPVHRRRPGRPPDGGHG